MSEEQTTTLSLTLRDGYAFTVDFGDNGIPPMTIDEPPPLGRNEGPSPSRVLASAIAGCLGASLLFCLRKSRIDVSGLRTDVTVTNGRNAKGRLRVHRVAVHLAPKVPADQVERMTRCLEVFEDFCVVSAAVRDGIAIDVTVDPQAT
ncbi:MAG: OsmC family protein [Gemmatimonadaceae bacterium]|nr:OsmC family protein [Gemmatimonadaceae bacterium]